MMTQVPVEITVNGSRLETRCGTRDAFEFVRAADDAHAGLELRRRRDFGAERSERLPSLAQRREQPPPAEHVHHARQPALVRAPQIGVRGDRSDLRRHDAAQAPGPILRIGEKGGSAREFGRKHALEIEQLPSEVEAARQVRRERLLERRPRRVVVGVNVAEPIELIIHRRQGDALVGHQNARGAVGCNRDRIDGKARADVLERADEKSPRAFRVEPEIRTMRVGRERRVGAAALRENLARVIERDDLDVGLAEVENRDAAGHGLNPDERPRRAAP